MSCAAPPAKFLWLSRIPAEILNFISQPNIFSAQFQRSQKSNQLPGLLPNNGTIYADN
jgi:hypothetical protein